MDFTKINEELKPEEVSSKLIKKPKEISVSFDELLSHPKKTYTLPSLGEISISSGHDSATISEGAKSAYYLSKIMSMVKDMPDTREAKIENAMKLLEQGLDNPKINREIAERLSNMLSPE